MRKLLPVWLLLLAAVQAYALVRLRAFAVLSEPGQRIDWVALSGNTIGAHRVEGIVHTVLNALGVASIAAATLFAGFIALARRRVLLAVVAAGLVAGANVTTQLVKTATVRPDLGVDMERVAAGNSFPSGHTTLAASVAIAFVLVLPAQVRAAGAVIGAFYAALAGTATMSAGWHRPSDAIAALVIVGAWAAIAGAVLTVRQPEEGFSGRQPPHLVTVVVLAAMAAVAFATATAALHAATDVPLVDPRELTRHQLFAAYAGSAAAIAGTSALVMAAFLATLHWVVPRRDPVQGGRPGVRVPAGQPRAV
jgi:membrane-associated phospholipid phosphatase